MIHTVGNISQLHTNVDNYFNTFKDDILIKTRLGWDEEDLRGKSYQQWKVMQYYNLLYYLIIMYNDYLLLSSSQPWSYFVSKYNLRDIKDCVACEGIDFRAALESFGFPGEINGIEELEVEKTLEVTGDEYVVSEISVLHRIATPSQCVNYIQLNPDPIIPVGGDENFDTIQDTITENDGEVSDAE